MGSRFCRKISNRIFARKTASERKNPKWEHLMRMVTKMWKTITSENARWGCDDEAKAEVWCKCEGNRVRCKRSMGSVSTMIMGYHSTECEFAHCCQGIVTPKKPVGQYVQMYVCRLGTRIYLGRK